MDESQPITVAAIRRVDAFTSDPHLTTATSKTFGSKAVALFCMTSPTCMWQGSDQRSVLSHFAAVATVHKAGHVSVTANVVCHSHRCGIAKTQFQARLSSNETNGCHLHAWHASALSFGLTCNEVTISLLANLSQFISTQGVDSKKKSHNVCQNQDGFSTAFGIASLNSRDGHADNALIATTAHQPHNAADSTRWLAE